MVLLMGVLIGMHVFTLEGATDAWNALPKVEATGTSLPAPVLKAVSLEFDGVVSDYLFLKALVFMGSKIPRAGQRFSLTPDEWAWFDNLLTVSVSLDPYFVDPYFVGNAYLTWDAGMVKEANALLEIGAQYRTWDWTIPFFIGFNYFYFLQENDKAAEYLMQASRTPGASPILASLASKLAFKAKRTESSIQFLEEMIKKTDDESLKKLFETRVQAFRAILALENAADAYQQKFRKRPLKLNDLVDKKIIAEIPNDPYGGKFYLDAEGTVKSTTDHMLMPYQRANRQQ